MTENENIENLNGQMQSVDKKEKCADRIARNYKRDHNVDLDRKRFYDEWSKCPLSFWEIIEKLDWKGACESDEKYPYKKVGELFNKLINGNPLHKESISETFRAYKTILKTVINDFEVKASGHRHCQNTIVWGGADDSFDDFTSHIIGLGKDTFFAVLADPILANKYQNEYRESFAYVFH